MQLSVSRTIHAPVDRVFDTIAHIENFSKAVPHIVKVEFLSETRAGVGTRFRETRIMRGKEASTELEVTEYVENDRVRIVADTHGTLWDTVFTVTPVDEGALLGMVMDAKPSGMAASLMTTMMKGMLQKALEQDLDAVKAYCESTAP
jgi:carbon monoxide dehydrogenase subunit G